MRESGALSRRARLLCLLLSLRPGRHSRQSLTRSRLLEGINRTIESLFTAACAEEGAMDFSDYSSEQSGTDFDEGEEYDEEVLAGFPGLFGWAHRTAADTVRPCRGERFASSR